MRRDFCLSEMRRLLPGVLCVVGLVATAAIHAQQAERAQQVQLEVAELDGQIIVVQGANFEREAISEQLPPPTISGHADAEAFLSEARQYFDAANYRDGLVVLEALIDKWPDALISTDREFYQPVRETISQMISRLPPDALRQWRITADGRARAILDDPENQRQLEPWMTVADRYFASSYGDDAALMTGTLLLDRGAYVQAIHYLSQVPEHPDVGVEADAVRETEATARLALAYLKSGQWGRAQQVIADLQAHTPNPRLDRQIEHLVSLSETMRSSSATSSDTTGISEAPSVIKDRWTVALGNTQRTAMMRAPSLKDHPVMHWPMVWKHGDPLAWKPPIAPQHRKILERRNLGRNVLIGTEARLIERWNDRPWFPVNQLRWSDDALVYKTHNQLVAVDRRTGQTRWIARELASRNIRAARHIQPLHARNGDHYESTSEMLNFATMIGHVVAIHDGRVFHYEGFGYGPEYGLGMRRYTSGEHLHGPTQNVLAAHDLNTGKILWKYPAIDTSGERENEGPMQIRFVSEILPLGDTVLACYERGSDLYLVQLDANSGQLLWEQFLCSVSPGSVVDYKPAGLTLWQGRLWIATGRGVVFCIDPYRQRIIWARTYPRDAHMQTGRGWALQSTRFDITDVGPRRNWMIMLNGRGVLMATDANRLFLMDPQDGKLTGAYPFEDDDRPLWIDESAMLIGVDGSNIWLASARRVTCLSVDFDGFTLLWQSDFHDNPITGKPLLTDQHVLVPTENRLVMLDAHSGKRLVNMTVARSDMMPLANLFSDGEHLFFAGMNRVAAYVDGPAQIARLSRAIDVNHDPRDLVARAQLFMQMQEPDKATDDLREALRIAQDPQQQDNIRHRLFEALVQQSENPDLAMHEAMKYLNEAMSVAVDPDQKTQVALLQARWYERADQPAEAARLYSMMQQDQAAPFVSIPSALGTLSARIDHVARSELERMIRQGHGPLIRQTLQQQATEALQQSRDVSGLLEVARRYHGTDAAVVAQLRAASALRTTAERYANSGLKQQRSNLAGQWEQAEQLLLEMARSQHELTTMAGLAGLAEHYQQSDLPDAAARYWRQLRDNHAGRTMLWWRPGEAGFISVEELVGARLAMLDTSHAGQEVTTLGSEPWAMRPWIQNKNMRPVDLIGGHRDAQVVEKQLILFSETQGERLIALRSDTGRHMWAHQSDQSLWAMMPQSHATQVGMLNGCGSGYLMAYRAGASIHIMGLRHGTPLWFTQPVDVESGDDDDNVRGPAHIHIDRDLSLLQHMVNEAHVRTVGCREFILDMGLLVVHDTDSQLGVQRVRAYDAATGSLRWIRRFKTIRVDAVNAADNYVLISTLPGPEILVCDRMTGQIVNRITPNLGVDGKPAIASDHGLILQDGTQVRAIDYQTGETKWQIGGGWNRIAEVRMIDDNIIAAIHSSDTTKLVHIADGRTLAQIPGAMLGSPISHMAINDSATRLSTINALPRHQVRLNVIDLTPREPQQLASYVIDPVNGQRVIPIFAEYARDVYPAVLEGKSQIIRMNGNRRSMMMYRMNLKLLRPELDDQGQARLEAFSVDTEHDAWFEHLNSWPELRQGKLVIVGHQGIAAVGPPGQLDKPQDEMSIPMPGLPE